MIFGGQGVTLFITDPDIGESGRHESFNFETTVGRSSLPLHTGENDIDNSTDSEDENYTEGMVNMLDFVSELQEISLSFFNVIV